MKVVIIEGPDNTGKSTLIQGLCSKVHKSLIIHSSKPKKDDYISQAVEQDTYFCSLAKELCEYANSPSSIHPDIVILDRAWPGEGVYGVLYRNNSIEYVKKMFKKIHHIIQDYNDRITAMCSYRRTLRSSVIQEHAGGDTIEVFYFFLKPEQSCATEFLLKTEDGLSIDGTSEAKTKEYAAFNNVYNILAHDIGTYSHVCVIKEVTVTKDGEFRNREDILNEVASDINL